VLLSCLELDIYNKRVYMDSETTPQDSKTVLLSPLPSLPDNLLGFYGVLSVDMQRLFIKVFKYLWGVVNGRRVSVITSFWCIDMLRTKLDLTSSQLALLSYLYQISNKGRDFVHSDKLYHSAILPHLARSEWNGSMQVLIYYLIKRGYVVRSRYDPGNTFYKSGRSRRPVFVRLSPGGIQLIEGIEKDINRLLMRSTLEELTGISNKKPG
jgi:hypothetical protein